jgi:uncharacterized tellurite resistance protein B-like protein
VTAKPEPTGTRPEEITILRTYPRNSPQAAARIVALAMLADGQLGRSELELIEHVDAPTQLGLDRAALNAVVHAFCEDLLAGMQLTWADACRVDPRTLDALVAEIDDPALRRRLLQLCVSIVESDGHVAEGESIVLASAVEGWGLQREMLQAQRAPAQAAAAA